MKPSAVLFWVLMMSLICMSLEGCPSNMFSVSGSNACFQFIKELMPWNASWARCASEGLVLAQPDDSIAVALRFKLGNTYGDGNGHYAWVSGRGSGSGWSWRDGAAAGPGSSSVAPTLVYTPGHMSNGSTSECLYMATFPWFVVGAYPTAPFGVRACSDNNHVLCQGCPSNMLSVPGTKTCFKLIKESMPWDLSWVRCASEGLVLAQPDDSIAVALRKKLLDTYGDGNGLYPWVSGRGSGSGWSWRDGAEAGSSSSSVAQTLVYPDVRSNDTTDDCLHVGTYPFFVVESHPNTPYGVRACSGRNHVLCQDRGTSDIAGGVWGTWSSWSQCSVSCGSGGARTRTRSCSTGTTACQGSGEETTSCDYVTCPIDADCPSDMFRVLDAETGSDKCFKLINESMSWQPTKSRCASEELVIAKPDDGISQYLMSYIHRNFGAGDIWVLYGTRNHLLPGEQEVIGTKWCLVPDISRFGPTTPSPTSGPCRTPPRLLCQGNGWGPWSSWGQCSRSCGGGEQRRYRTCLGGGECKVSTTDHEPRLCNPASCPVDEEPGICKHIKVESCSIPTLAADCPQTCSQKESRICKHIKVESCNIPNLAADCPQTCSKKEEPAICKHIKAESCNVSSIAADCPQTCPQRVLITQILE